MTCRRPEAERPWSWTSRGGGAPQCRPGSTSQAEVGLVRPQPSPGTSCGRLQNEHESPGCRQYLKHAISPDQVPPGDSGAAGVRRPGVPEQESKTEGMTDSQALLWHFATAAQFAAAPGVRRPPRCRWRPPDEPQVAFRVALQTAAGSGYTLRHQFAVALPETTNIADAAVTVRNQVLVGIPTATPPATARNTKPAATQARSSTG